MGINRQSKLYKNENFRFIYYKLKYIERKIYLRQIMDTTTIERRR